MSNQRISSVSDGGMQKVLLILISVVIIFFSSCVRDGSPFPEGKGKRPVYLSKHLLDSIKNLPPQPIGLTGTIFLQDTLFLMLEQKKGIHVYRLDTNSDPLAMTFFQIPAISDFTINGNVLYADSWTDLLAIDISNIYQINVLSRTRDVFQPILYPPLYTGIFECADESKGAIVAWEDVYLDEARCQRRN